MKMTVFSDVAPRSLVEIDRSFRGAYCLHDQGDDGGSKHVYIRYIFTHTYTHIVHVRLQLISTGSFNLDGLISVNFNTNTCSNIDYLSLLLNDQISH
jgi:hypothetical protein